MKKLSRKFWLWCGIGLAALVGLIVSLAKGWSIAAIIFAVALAIAGLFAAKEWRAANSMTRCTGMVADTVRNVIVITKNPMDSGQVVGQ